MNIHFTHYARSRHTPTSPKSHYAGSEQSLLALVADNFGRGRQGYKSGVWLVPVPPASFFTGVVQLCEGDVVQGRAVRRALGEDLYTEVTAPASDKSPAVACDIVLYSHAVLAEHGENESDAEWEVISINARETAEDKPEPQNPVAMARNMLGRPGGTKATYTAEQFCEAILYWQSRAMAGS